jgi:pyrimidine operon attenuation protein/uracil phosphoribosyltransferase
MAEDIGPPRSPARRTAPWSAFEPAARRLPPVFNANSSARHGWDLPLGVLDITLYRDDLSQLAEQPLVRSTEIDFDVSGKLIFLIDDVLFTGRTIRSALDALVDFGRPRRIMLGVLIDRGHREFPIQADVAALTVQTTRGPVRERLPRRGRRQGRGRPRAQTP